MLEGFNKLEPTKNHLFLVTTMVIVFPSIFHWRSKVYFKAIFILENVPETPQIKGVEPELTEKFMIQGNKKFDFVSIFPVDQQGH